MSIYVIHRVLFRSSVCDETGIYDVMCLCVILMLRQGERSRECKRARSFWHSNVGRRRRKRICTNPTPSIHRSKGSFINIFDMLPTLALFLARYREKPHCKRTHSLIALRFYRNNMLIARRRSLKSAPINSRDFWRNFAPSRRRRSVFRKILFARTFRRLERTLPYRVTCPSPSAMYIYHRSDILFSVDHRRSSCRVALGTQFFFSRSKHLTRIKCQNNGWLCNKYQVISVRNLNWETWK